GELNELVIPAGSKVVGKKLVELGIPQECLIVLIVRGNEYILPSGATSLAGGDTLLVLSDKETFARIVSEINTKGQDDKPGNKSIGEIPPSI
ncbi:MAG: hypothetical protein GXY28_06925, partial [Bacteriovoracaceae bacterium]|nr:hypothetical protein [Bacteriovoracaceae bacterium]